MIILLNGTSSVGKSSIASEIHAISKDPFLIFCMDAFFGMLHPRYDGLGKYHLEKRKGDGKLGFYTSDIPTGYRIEGGELGFKVGSALPQAIAVTAKTGLNLIVPTVINDYYCLNLYRKALEGLEYLLVYIDCEREEIKRRETARGDRLKGTSLDLLDRFETANEYDFKVDSTNTHPRELAVEILKKFNIEMIL
jgi:chloramphenicol 3-O phosphotransferase